MDTAHDVKSDQLRKELDFIKRLFGTAKTVDAFVAAARAAVKVTQRAAKELQAAEPREKASSSAPNTVTLRGLPTKGNWGWVQVKDLLKSLELPAPVRVEKRPDSDVAVLTFKDSSEAAAVISGGKLGGHVVEEHTIKAELGSPSAEEMAALQEPQRGSKRGQEGQGQGKGAKVRTGSKLE